ncbi:hypothetical protein [Streptomyces sp. NPDC093589]|uniref:hypothetical protein n=1 Tax=Streptomyces sp. NPDC093589 TaxID=3366043 RepID=UPI0038129F34
MDTNQIDKAVSTRARVRISERLGWAAGMEGIAMGYRATYDSIKVGFVDTDGDYTGEYTTVPRKSVEMKEIAASHQPESGFAERADGGEHAPFIGSVAHAAELEARQAIRDMWRHGSPRCPLTRYAEASGRLADRLA